MPGDIGPGPLMCISTITCQGCGKGVTSGRLYQCIGLYECDFFQFLAYGPCACGEIHPYVILQAHNHVYCPHAFAPIGDPDAEIKETDEPKLTAPVKPLTIEEFAKRFINV